MTGLTVLSLTLTRTPDLLEKSVNSHGHVNLLRGYGAGNSSWCIHHINAAKLLSSYDLLCYRDLNELPPVCHEIGVIIMHVSLSVLYY